MATGVSAVELGISIVVSLVITVSRLVGISVDDSGTVLLVVVATVVVVVVVGTYCGAGGLFVVVVVVVVLVVLVVDFGSVSGDVGLTVVVVGLGFPNSLQLHL